MSISELWRGDIGERRFRGKLIAWFHVFRPAMVVLALALSLRPQQALADTCREQGGNQTCTADQPLITDWSYSVFSCLPVYNCLTSFDQQVCTTFGGTLTGGYQGCYGCGGTHPQDNLIASAVQNGWTANDSACAMSAIPGGWGMTMSQSTCTEWHKGEVNPQDPPQYANGIETSSYEAVPASGTKTTQNG
jgi:hypothetical protein